MYQRWDDLLFAHWRVDASALRDRLPAGVVPDLWDGSAWVGVTPFEVASLRLRGTPRLARFPEINVRTYVTVDGRPGIWFLSLDAASRTAVFAARRAYRLPYFKAEIRIARRGDWIRYSAFRQSDDGPPARFAARYRPDGAVCQAQPGTFEHFAAERYCLYTLDRSGRLLRGDIDHPPWPLQPAVAELGRNSMAAPYGLELDGEPLLHYAGRQDVVIWPLTKAGDR